ncbi:unnamed protein product, partial [Meganyctiphanes norvegica]
SFQKSKYNVHSITKTHFNPSLMKDMISTDSSVAFSTSVDCVKNNNDLSPHQSSSSKKKWKRSSTTFSNGINVSPGSSHLIYESKLFTNTPSPTSKTTLSFTSSPSPSSKKVLSLGGSPKSNLLQRCFQKLNGGTLSTLNRAEVVKDAFKQNEISYPSGNSTNTSSKTYYRPLKPKPLSKEYKNEDQIPFVHKNVLSPSNGISSSSQSPNSDITNQENINTPPTRTKKFGLESSPGSDLLARCLKKLGYDDNDTDLRIENLKEQKENLHGDNKDQLPAASISDIKQRFFFEIDNENILDKNEVNTKSMASPSTQSTLSNSILDSHNLQNNFVNLDKKLHVKSWMEDYKVKMEAFQDENILSIINETTKKSRCNCRRGDCSRKLCSCQRSGGSCSSQCGCQSSVCKNRASATLSNISPLAPRLAPSMNATPPFVSHARQKSQADVIKNPEKVVTTPQDKVPILPTTNNEVPSAPLEKILIYCRTGNSPLKPLNVVKNPEKIIKTPGKEISIYDRLSNSSLMFLSTKNNPVNFIKTPGNEISNQPFSNNELPSSEEKNAMHSTSSNPPLKLLITSPSTTTMFIPKLKLPQSEDTILLPATEPVNSHGFSDNSLQRNDESSILTDDSVAINKPADNLFSRYDYMTRFSKESEGISKTSADNLSGNQVFLLPESLMYLRNPSESPTNLVYETTSTNTPTAQTVPISDMSNLQSRILLSEMNFNTANNIPNIKMASNTVIFNTNTEDPNTDSVVNPDCTSSKEIAEAQG